MHIVDQTPDPIDRVLGEVPLPSYVTAEDVQLAVRAVVVHAAEDWPAGPQCRNDGAPYPCRLHRWGRRVLAEHGLSERQIDAVERHGNPFLQVPARGMLLSGQTNAPARPGAGAPGTRPGVGAPGTRPGAGAPGMRPTGMPGRPGAGTPGLRPQVVPGRPGMVPGRPQAVPGRPGMVPGRPQGTPGRPGGTVPQPGTSPAAWPGRGAPPGGRSGVPGGTGRTPQPRAATPGRAPTSRPGYPAASSGGPRSGAAERHGPDRAAG